MIKAAPPARRPAGDARCGARSAAPSAHPADQRIHSVAHYSTNITLSIRSSMLALAPKIDPRGNDNERSSSP